MKSCVFVARGDLKNATLSAIDSGLNKSRDIFLSMDYPSYQNFHKNLYNLVRRGYIHQSGKKPKSRYTLTKKGKFHLANPNYYQEKKDLVFSKKLEAVMKNTDMFKSMMIKLSNEEMQNKIRNGQNVAPSVVLPVDKSGSDFGEGDNNQIGSEDDNKINSDNDKLIDYLQNQVKVLKIKNREIEGEKEILIENNQNLTNQIKSGKGTPKVKSNNNFKLTSTRKKLANQYLNNGGYLDLKFFEEWGIHPCLLKGAKIFNKGSIDIISKSNEEFQRGHVKRLLTDQEIINSGMRILKYDENGIWVSWQGMNKTKILKFDRFTKTARPQTKLQGKPQVKPTQTQTKRVSIKASKRM